MFYAETTYVYTYHPASSQIYPQEFLWVWNHLIPEKPCSFTWHGTYIASPCKTVNYNQLYSILL